MSIRTFLAACLFGLAAAAPASAAFVEYQATLNGANEFPANTSLGTGTALVRVDLDAITMRIQINFSGLTGNVTASHIHCCTGTAGSGVVGVASVTPTFTDFPLGVKAGTYDHTFDLSLADSYNPAFITGHGGTVSSAFDALILGLDANEAYLNIHTDGFPGGEIRGFLRSCGVDTACPGTAGLPEPDTLALLGAALAGIAALGRRRR